MDAETLAGLMGLGGALVGAGVSVWATVVTQQHQARGTREQRVAERGWAAGEKALSELYALRRRAVEHLKGEPPRDEEQWRLIARTHMDEAGLALELMPQADELRQRISFVLGHAYVEMSEQAGNIDAQLILAQSRAIDAIALIGAHMRGDPLPALSDADRRLITGEG